MEILDVLFLFISFLMIISADWACGYFGLSCFEQIVFHLKVPLEGTNKEFIYDFFKLCFLKALLLAIAAFFILHFFNIAGNLILILIFIISLIISGQRIKIWGYIFNLFRKIIFRNYRCRGKNRQWGSRDKSYYKKFLGAQDKDEFDRWWWDND